MPGIGGQRHGFVFCMDPMQLGCTRVDFKDRKQLLLAEQEASTTLKRPLIHRFQGKGIKAQIIRYFKVYHMYTVDIYYTAYLRMIHMEVS
jgi:hypothetical protein